MTLRAIPGYIWTLQADVRAACNGCRKTDIAQSWKLHTFVESPDTWEEPQGACIESDGALKNGSDSMRQRGDWGGFLRSVRSSRSSSRLASIHWKRTRSRSKSSGQEAIDDTGYHHPITPMTSALSMPFEYMLVYLVVHIEHLNIVQGRITRTKRL